MFSKKRLILAEIANGITSWEPENDSIEALEEFQGKATELVHNLHALVTGGLVGKYSIHKESYTGNHHIDRIVISVGLTEAGKDRRNWPR